MLYLSSILDKALKIEDGTRIGRIRDLTMKRDAPFPRIASVILGSMGRKMEIPFEKIKHIDSDEIIVHGADRDFPEPLDSDEKVYLRRDVLDKQIVDVNGQRVVRVNDIQLNRVGDDLRAAGVDVGTPGLLRRMGLLNIAEKVALVLKLKTPTNIIPWDMVQTLGAGPASAITLSTTAKKLTRLHPADLADILEELPRKERRQIFEYLDNETAAEALEQMEDEFQVALLETLPDEKAADLLEEMSPDEAADLLQDLSDQRAKSILNLMDAEDAEEVKELLIYEEDTAGGLMSNEFVPAKPELTCTQTIELIRQLEPETELVYYVYIVEENERLLGVISLRDLIVADPEARLKDIMVTDFVSVPTNADLKEVTELIAKYDLLAIPVVDEKLIIKGIVTVDDVMDELLLR